MKTLRLLLSVPVLALACSSPTAPTPAAPANPVPTLRATSFSMLISPDSDPVTGFRSPMSLTLRAYDEVGPADIQSAVFRMLDDQGHVLTEATIALGAPLSVDSYLSGNVVVQTLGWPLENGRGRKIDGSVTFRAASGEVRTLPISFPAR